MITYTNGVPEIFAEAAADKSAGWTKTEKINLLQLAELMSNNDPTVYSENWGTGRIYWIRGHKTRFLLHRAADGKTNLGVVGK